MIDDFWHKNGVSCWLSVGTYMDAYGDGVGDFRACVASSMGLAITRSR